MWSADEEVLETCLRWTKAGQPVAWVTLVRVQGSSPRPLGSLLALNAAGDWVGAVSGGCVEARLVAQICAHWPVEPRIEAYDAAQHPAGLGVPCGGALELLIEPLLGEAQLLRVLNALRTRQPVLRRVCLNTGEISLHPAKLVPEFQFEAQTIARVFGPQWRVVLIGAGQLSRFVTQMALALEYDVIVCEPRAHDARQWSLPGVTPDTRMPDEVVAAFGSDARCAVLALTHDAELDDLALVQALPTEAFYVGALGSMANCAARRKRLRWLGVTDGAIARLHAPVGLSIGSKTPAEIAVSILAGMIAIRNQNAATFAGAVDACIPVTV